MRRMRLLALLALPAMGALGATPGCAQNPTTPIEQAPPSHPAGPPLLPPSVRELHDGYARAFRLGLDRRLLLAVADVHHVITRWKRTEVEHEFFEGKWHLRYLGQEVGSLPEYPDFGDMLAVLSAWAAHVEKDRPLKLDGAAPKSESGDLLGHQAAFELLQRSQKAFGTAPTRDGVHEATRALVSLAMQLVDETELCDSVFARALALLAIDQGVGHVAALREEALLAWSLGFPAAAKTTATKLPDDDPVRAFTSGDDATLGKLAEDPAHDSAATRWLFHSRLLATRDFAGAAAYRTKKLRDRALSLEVLGDRLRARDPSEAPVAHALSSIVMLNIAREASMSIAPRVSEDVRGLGDGDDGLAKAVAFVSGWLEIQREETISRMEPELPKVGLGDVGPFMDGSTHQDFYRAFAFSALYHLAILGLETHRATATVVDDLRGAKSLAAMSFREWYVKLCDAQLAKVSIADLFVKQESLAALGPRPALELVTEIARHDEWTNPALSGAVRRLFPRLDTRVSNRILLAGLARRSMLDRFLAERLEKSNAATGTSVVVPIPAKGDPLLGLASRAETQWKNGELDLAAETLASPPLVLGRHDWRTVIGPRFADAFVEGSNDQPILAFEALERRALSKLALVELASAIDDRGRHALAFQLAQRIEAKQKPGIYRLEDLALSMRMHGIARAGGLALDPSRSPLARIPPPFRLVAHVAAFGERQDAALALLAPEAVGPTGEGELVWLLRAAAARRSNDEGRLRALRSTLQAPATSDYRRIARYLVGLDDEASVLALATTQQRACEVAFYLGVRAQAEGRGQDASDWFHAAIDTGHVASLEHRWAHDALRALTE